MTSAPQPFGRFLSFQVQKTGSAAPPLLDSRLISARATSEFGSSFGAACPCSRRGSGAIAKVVARSMMCLATTYLPAHTQCPGQTRPWTVASRRTRAPYYRRVVARQATPRTRISRCREWTIKARHPLPRCCWWHRLPRAQYYTSP